MGFLNYPIGRLLGGRKADARRTTPTCTGKGGGLSKYFRMTTDHKVIGLQYLVMILAFLFIGGLGAMFIRSRAADAVADSRQRRSRISRSSGCTAR